MDSADAQSVFRIIDANLNRAREALRVVEDYARFSLDDRALAASLKQLRHDLRTIADELGPTALLAARDVAGDVGLDTKTESELHRADLQDALRAAFGRLTESLRVIGECLKISAPTPAAAGLAERLRYRAYALEQTIILRGPLRARFAACRLYVIITESLCRRHWLETAAAAIRGGAGCIQLREKTLPDAELLDRARQLRELTARENVLLIINDRPDIARLSGADGVHVGQEDLSVQQVRRIAGGRLLVGKSTHTRAQFDAAQREEPDYIAVGPMFQSTTKPQSHIAGPETLRWATERATVPLVAIGGITHGNAGAIRDSDACLCVCSTIISCEYPETAAQLLVPEAAQRELEQ